MNNLLTLIISFFIISMCGLVVFLILTRSEPSNSIVATPVVVDSVVKDTVLSNSQKETILMMKRFEKLKKPVIYR